MSKVWNENPIAIVRIKLRNRRVKVGLRRDGGYLFQFTKLEGGKPINTRISLSKEATIAMVKCILHFENGKKGNHE